MMLGSDSTIWSEQRVLSIFERTLIRRYLWPGGEGRIIVLVAAIGMTAVALGVAALIIVMSVMNGARTKLGVQFAGLDGHASITPRGHVMPNWRALEVVARRQQAVLSTQPALEAAVFASSEGRAYPARLRGVRTFDMQSAPILRGGRTFGGKLPLESGEVVLGVALATKLGVTLGSEITLIRPQVSPENDISLKSVNHVVTGIVQTNLPQHDDLLVFMDLPAAQNFLESGDTVSRVNILTADAERVGELLEPLALQLRGRAILRTWRELNPTIFEALAVERVGMFIAISMVVLVALFNILSSLLMLVSSKLRDVAIMRTMGASRASITKVFVAVGTAIGSLGAAAGCFAGLTIVAGKDTIANLLENHVIGAAYGTELRTLADLPAQIDMAELGAILLMAVGGTVLVTLYPAFKAASVHPASSLRY
jgi:lipoprotein-releasing system permease protein